MADNETITDIIAEMRRGTKLPGYWRSCDVNEILQYHAERIEAAIKRERGDCAKLREAVDYLCERMADIDATFDPTEVECLRAALAATTEKLSAVGDAAKLREALEHIKDRLPHMLQYMRVHWEDASAGGYFDELMLVIDAALAAPPRNCDKYATADEALKAQEQMFNDSNFANGECKLGCPECDNPRVGCKIAWLYAPATGKEGGAK